jgi:hypothetical protein
VSPTLHNLDNLGLTVVDIPTTVALYTHVLAMTNASFAVGHGATPCALAT